MPYYCGPRISSKTNTTDDGPSDDNTNSDKAHHSHCQSILSAIVNHNCYGLSLLSIIPVHFGDFDSVTPFNTHALMNHKRIPAYAQQVLQFNWAIYSFEVGTSCPILPCTIFLSASNLPATSTSTATHLCANLQHVLIYSAAGMSLSIISDHPATVCRFTDT